MKHLFAIICILAYITTNQPDIYGYSHAHNEFARHIIYTFHHVSWLHLVCNIAVLYMIKSPFQYFKSTFVWAVAFAASFAASYLSVGNLPTIGSSGITYAIMGIMLYVVYRLRNRKIFIINLLIILLPIPAQAITPYINYQLHFYSLTIAFAIAYISDWQPPIEL